MYETCFKLPRLRFVLLQHHVFVGKAERYAEIEWSLFGNTPTALPECLPCDEKVQTRTPGFLFNIVCSVVLFFNTAWPLESEHNMASAFRPSSFASTCIDLSESDTTTVLK